MTNYLNYIYMYNCKTIVKIFEMFNVQSILIDFKVSAPLKYIKI